MSWNGPGPVINNKQSSIDVWTGEKMRRSENISKVRFKDTVPTVTRSLIRYPKLLIPFLVPILLWCVNKGVRILMSNYCRDVDLPKWLRAPGELIIGAGPDYWVLIVYWQFFEMLIGFFIGIFLAGWIINSYWTYWRKGRVKMLVSLKESKKFYLKMIAANIIVGLILFIPINLVGFLVLIMIARWSGVQDYIFVRSYASLPWVFTATMVTVLFSFKYHGIIIEKRKVLSSIKRSVKVCLRNYWLYLFIVLIPTLLIRPFVILGWFSMSGPLREFFIPHILVGVIPLIGGWILAPIISYSMTRGFILSTQRQKVIVDVWDS